MNRNMALWLSMVMGATMGTGTEPTDAHCEKDGKHCTFLRADDTCRLYDVLLETDSEGHRRSETCKERNFIIGRTE